MPDSFNERTKPLQKGRFFKNSILLTCGFENILLLSNRKCTHKVFSFSAETLEMNANIVNKYYAEDCLFCKVWIIYELHFSNDFVKRNKLF